MENLLLDLMYNLSSMENLKEVVINEEFVNGQAEPLLVYEENKQKNAS